MESGAVSVITDGMMSMLLSSVDSLSSRKDQLFVDKIITSAYESSIKTAYVDWRHIWLFWMSTVCCFRPGIVNTYNFIPEFSLSCFLLLQWSV